MKGKIITILDKCLNTYYDDYFRRADISGKSEAAEGIEKMYNDMNCGNCQHCDIDKFGAAGILICPVKHLTAPFGSANSLKCNQWEAKQ